jgi:imidazolonepropionase-like amidohydrolase
MTANGAKVLGEYDTYGSIERGKRADLVVIHGDPISTPADIRRVVTVFRDGIGYDAAKLVNDVAGQVGVR